MPSPFPAMDPYLERPAIWPGLHQALMTFMMVALNQKLPSHYVANINERIYVDEPRRGITPDAHVVRRTAPEPVTAGGAAVAEAVATDPHWVLTLSPDEVREAFIEILPAGDEGRVVTVIEPLSPSNKTPGVTGRDQYLQKQREVLDSETHLLEIDLLRQGQHTVAAPKGQLARRGVYDYLVSLSRGPRHDRFEVWPITVRGRLPRVAVPLLGDDPDVVLDLQPLLDQCYDAGNFVRRIDYNQDPEPPLPRADAEWADALLRERGLRRES